MCANLITLSFPRRLEIVVLSLIFFLYKHIHCSLHFPHTKTFFESNINSIMGATSMARVTRYLPAGFRRELSRQKLQQFGETNLVDVEFDFLVDHCDEFQNNDMELDFEDDDCIEKVNEESCNHEESRNFWDNQLQVLQTHIYRTSSMEISIRNATKEAIEEIDRSKIECSCSRQIGVARSCPNCFMSQVSRYLQNAGFNTAICNTKWKTSHNIPSGEHTFLDVVYNTNKEKADIRVIIELNFRAQFEIGKASENYNCLVKKLPEVYVGKAERLSNIIKIMCLAAKKCLKENKMHMGPWRKHKYMQAKWLGPCKRNTSINSLSMGYCERISPKQKPKASMLTVDLLENMHYTALEVV